MAPTTSSSPDSQPKGTPAPNDLLPVFRCYSQLERKRMSASLSVAELEEWSRLKRLLDRRLSGPGPAGREERRQAVRVPTRLRCRFASCGALSQAFITNLSTGGVFVATESPLALGSKLQLQIEIEASGAKAEVEGVVVSTGIGPDGAGGVSGMGVRFTGATTDTIERINDLYAQEIEREYAGKQEEVGD